MSSAIRKLVQISIISSFCAVMAFALPTYASDDESHLPPGFRSKINIDPNLVIIYQELKGQRRDLRKHEIYKVLSGDETGNFHLLYNYDEYGMAEGNTMLPAWRCDGGYALVDAMFAKVRWPQRKPAGADWIDYKRLDKVSPSMKYLISGMKGLIATKRYDLAEPDLLKAIFINLFGKETGIRKAEQYLASPDTRDAIIAEAGKQIDSMTFSQEEYDLCNASTESTRLMLAQWGAWALTNTYWLVSKQEDDDAHIRMQVVHKEIEETLEQKSSLKIRADSGPKYLNSKI